MAMKKGNLSINSENMLPIIKKWMYSDHDIFVRELVSNGCDAITKLNKLSMIGEYTKPEDKQDSIHVIVNPEEKTLKFIDTGLGMTEQEVEEYITQIAFSGATQFVEKYKGKADGEQIIGHFGLGFYSAFMVAHQVDIDTLSYQEGAKAVHWESDGESEYEIGEGTRDVIGTEITLHLNEDSYEFCNEYRMREVLERYCSFMPVEIYLENANAPKPEPEEPKEGEESKEPEAPKPVNDIHPLWTKHPNECSDDDYKDFYRKVFNDYKEPLFWIHLNMDYPFNLKGILYFPKINTEYDSIEGTIKLYNNQVFIADNIKEVIPEFLMLLKGVIDCPDLPLNVSRSALQNDGFVKKIADYISKKVADKLSGMCKTEREAYEGYWDDISPFIKFGCIKDEKFADKMMKYVLFKDLDNKYLTLEEYKEKNNLVADQKTEEPEAEVLDADGNPVESEDSADTEEPKYPEKDTVFYVTDEVQQIQYINMFKAEGKDAVILKHNIDNPFITQLERRNETLRFMRIDADLTDDFKGEDSVSEDDAKSITETFRKALNNDKLEVRVENLKDDDISSMMILSEENRRMQEMMKMYGMAGMDPTMFGGQETLVLNANHPLVKFVLEHKRSKNVPVICEQLYDLAMLAHKPLNPDEMTRFVKRSNEIMLLLTK